ncbi:FecR family protein [Prolixibacteraceae bacterium Z1-6]|uniref:FecR family protein n=1 Tax=Draconibacterium aestuarii TaxID=2998507 RepID=A0A9X3F366_9BACT|nr:FecR family protein [Prolixibacteraceae bacterium Z1-6]
MKNLFKKYYRSVLVPGDFPEIAAFLNNKKNEAEVFNLMKRYWEKEINETNVSSKTNPALLERIKNTILLDKHKRAQRKIKIYRWGLRVAAVIVLALLLCNIFQLKRATQNNLVETLQTISTPYGAKTNITLPDGSLVWLNSGSTLTYPTKFISNRIITLEGEAFFDVEKNNSPFIVSTNFGDVIVKGTSFNVKTLASDNTFETTLEEGVVVFDVKNSQNEVVLKPGEQVVKTSKGFTIKNVDIKYFTSWKDGKLMFNKEPFPDFIKKLERWYNVKIVYNDPKLDELWYTGTIEMESISEVMEMISKAAPVSYHFNNKTRIFTIRTK